MKIVAPKRAQSFREIERSLRALDWDKSGYQLRLPVELKLMNDWLEFSFLQYLMTMRDSSDDSMLLIPARHNDGLKDVMSVASTLPGMLAVAFCKQLRAEGSDRDLSGYRHTALNAWSSEKNPSAVPPQKGSTTRLVCLDMLGFDNNPWLYPFVEGDVAPWGPETFTKTTRSILSRLSKHFSTPGTLVTNTSEDIGNLVYELFLNTHDWGRHRLDNRPIQPSMRGISYTLQKNVTHSDALPAALATYVAALSREDNRQDIHFLIISVVDGGLGLASRFENRQFRATETSAEFTAVLKCFRKHSSTSQYEGRGLGLYQVRSLLRALKAFIRIRTGRLHLFSEFLTYRTSQEKADEPPSIRLLDWTTLDDRPTACAPVSGTLYEIYIPVMGWR
jgi:hypothetical protein